MRRDSYPQAAHRPSTRYERSAPTDGRERVRHPAGWVTSGRAGAVDHRRRERAHVGVRIGPGYARDNRGIGRRSAEAREHLERGDARRRRRVGGEEFRGGNPQRLHGRGIGFGHVERGGDGQGTGVGRRVGQALRQVPAEAHARGRIKYVAIREFLQRGHGRIPHPGGGRVELRLPRGGRAAPHPVVGTRDGPRPAAIQLPEDGRTDSGRERDDHGPSREPLDEDIECRN